MKSDLISVVVPCYNVEKYLEKCVNSIINQTYGNLEIILIDDGATDSTPKLCDKLALTDSRIRVIHKENGGLSDARNAGISNARGNYITFFDSDDWLEPDIIRIAYEKILKENSDLVVWGYSADFVDNNENVLNSHDYKVSGNCEKGNSEILTRRNTLGLCGYAWNKLYKIQIINNNNLEFPKGVSLVEDILFNSLYFSKCNRISFIDYIGNHYMQRGRLTLGNSYYENVFGLKLKACEARENILKHFCVEQIKISEIIGNFYLGALKSAVSNVALNSNFCFKEKRKLLKTFLNDVTTKEIVNKVKVFSFKSNIFLFLLKRKMIGLLLKIK